MDLLERALREHGDSLTHQLADTVGLSRREAEVFLREAGSALLDSWRWQSDRLGGDPVRSKDGVRDLLAGISGRRLAPRVGLSSERTWEGLRALVPAVVRATAASMPQAPDPVHSASPDRRSGEASADKLEIGFGLSLDRARPNSDAGRDRHPIFGRLLRAEDGLA